MPEPKVRSRPKAAKADPEQSAEFIRVARELGCEENFAEFEAALPRITRAHRPAEAKVEAGARPAGGKRPSRR
jgi:hypothetical protein